MKGLYLGLQKDQGRLIERSHTTEEVRARNEKQRGWDH